MAQSGHPDPPNRDARLSSSVALVPSAPLGNLLRRYSASHDSGTIESGQRDSETETGDDNLDVRMLPQALCKCVLLPTPESPTCRMVGRLLR